MVVSFEKKFCFIKNYKVAGSSIEKVIYPYLTQNDIIGQTEDYKGINHLGDFDVAKLRKHLPKDRVEKNLRMRLKYYAHMPAWLVRHNLSDRVYSKLYKFAVLRNPWDLVVSHYKWQNSEQNPLRDNRSFESIIDNLANENPYYGVNNLNRICALNSKKIIVDKIINFDFLEQDLRKVLSNFGISDFVMPKLKQLPKTSYQDFYSPKQKDVVYKFFKRTIALMKYDF